MRQITAKFSAFIMVIAFMGSTITPASARILFQIDDYSTIQSQGLQINSDDAGDEDVTIQLGDDGTDSNITFDDGTGNTSFSTAGGAFDFSDDSISTTGAALFQNVSSFRIREDSDPDTNADCTTVGELIFDTTDAQLQRCTAAGSPGSWTNVDTTGGSSDFEAVYTNDAGNNLITSNGIFTVNTGTNDFIIVSSDWGVDSAGNITVSGTVDGYDVGTIGGQAHDQNTDTGSTTPAFTLDSDNVGAGVNVDVVANQGSDADGTLRYDTTLNEWQISNNGGAFVAISTGASHAQNTDTGTTANTFTLDNDDTGGNVVLKFGTTLAETLTWDNANTRWAFSDDIRVEGNAAIVGQAFIADDHSATDSDGTLNLGRNGNAWETLKWDDAGSQFDLSDDLDVTGNITITGTVDGYDVGTIGGQAHDQNTDTGSTTPTFTLDSDNVGAGINVDIVANQGSDADGTLRYDTTTNAWQISNNGGAFAAIGTGGSQDFEGVYSTDVDKILTTTNGTFTIEAGTGAVNVNSTTGGVSLNASINGAVNIGTGSSTGTVTLGGTGTQSIAVGNGAGVKTVSLGSSNTTSTTTLLSGSGGLALNVSNNQSTNINTGSSTGSVNIGGTGTQSISIGDGAGSKTVSLGSSTTTSTTTLLSGSGGLNFNVGNNQATNINTGSSTGTVTLGGTGTQTIAVGNGAGVKTVNLGSSNTTSTTNLLSGSGGLNQNVDNNQATNINTGTSTGTLTLGGTGTQTIAVGDGAGVKTVSLGSSNTTSTTTLLSGSGGLNFNVGNNQATNINTGSSTGTVTLGGTGTQTIAVGNGAGVKTVNLGSSNTTSTTTLLSGSGGLKLNVDNNQVTNIGTGTSTGAITFGGNLNTVAVNSSSWDISTSGTITGATWDGTAIDADSGGTGQTSYAVGDLLYASTTSALSKLAAGADGLVLAANGAGVAPSWQTATTMVTGAGSTSATAATVGTQVTDTATCAAGKLILGGGGLVTTTDASLKKAVLVSSYPSSTTVWTAIGMVADTNLGAGKTITATAYALCSP